MSSDPFPSRAQRIAPHGEHVLLQAPRRETLMEEELLGLVVRQRECPHLGCLGLLAATKLQQEGSPDGVKKVVSLKIMLQSFDLVQGRLGPSHVAHRHSPRQCNDWL